MSDDVKPATDEEISKWRNRGYWTSVATILSYDSRTGRITGTGRESAVRVDSPIDERILALCARIDQLKAQLAAVTEPVGYW